MLLQQLSSRRFFILIRGVLLILAAPSFGQQGASTPSSLAPSAPVYVPTMVFDVASVRENKNVDPIAGIEMSGGFAPSTTSLRVVNWSVENLLELAYGVNPNQITGTPKWPFPTLFIIQAKADSAADAKIAALSPAQQESEQQHMLQTLLQDRFKLKAHWQDKQGDVYKLVVAKNGPRLKQAGDIQHSAEQPESSANESLPAIYQKNDQQGYDFIAHGCSMDVLAAILSTQFGRPVIDETKLTEKYDFVLKYKGRWDQDRNATDLDSMPPLDRALQEQLGLKVEQAKGPVKILVIDHIEKPTEN